MVPGRGFADLNPAGGPARGSNLRLFYALWPGAALRQRLAKAAESAVRRSGGRPVPPGHYHLTLAFLGSVPGANLASLIELGGRVRGEPVKVVFDRIDYWPRPKVLVALATEDPAAGLALVQSLWERLQPHGYEREARPWRPHLTLARQIRERPADGLALETADGKPLAAEFTDFALVESASAPRGVRYRAIAEWPLGRGLSHPMT